jgi:CARDB
LAFLDEEQDDLVVADEPERPRRRVGGPQRRRQQFLVRRLIGVGVGVAFLILLVIGFRGCLEARSDRALRNYDSDIATIMQQSEQSGKDFFQVLSTPSGGSSSIDVRNQVLAQRDASSTLLDRADSLDAPGQMHDAQAAVEQTLTLRRNALSAIASNVTQAAARTQTASAITTIGNAMGALYASDILWTQLGAPEIKRVLQEEGVDGQPLPPGKFMPANATDYLNQATLVTKLNAITGTTTTTGGVHGLQLDSTTIGGTTLQPDTSNNVPSDAQEIDIQVTNSGDSDETGITVDVTLGGSALHGTLQSLSAGQSGSVKIPLTTKPSPGSDTTLQVVVSPVPGEQLTDNNTSTYTVVFGS